MRYLSFLLLLTITAPQLSQIIENVPLRQFQEFPQAEIKNFSIGSYGFGNRQNSYNPYYSWDDTSRVLDRQTLTRLYISLGGAFNSGGRRQFSIQPEENKNFENVLTFRPDFLAKFWYRNFLLQLSYANEYQLRLMQSGVNYSYDLDPFTIDINKQEVKVAANTLLLALSMLTSPSFSLTVGASTKSLSYTWIPGDLQPAEFKTGLFNNLQYLFSANFKLKERLQSYLLFRTQTANEAIIDGSVKLNGVEIPFPQVVVSYYGLVGYGVLGEIGERANLSIEMRHQFLEAVDTTQAALAAGTAEKHIWNNEIVFGASVKPAARLKIGALFSYYLKYDNNLYYRYISGEVNGEPAASFARIAHPYSVAISGEYAFRSLILRGFYQYSKSSYQTGSTDIVKDSGQFISFQAGYYFSL